MSEINIKKHFTVALAGNPNVGKSTVFNQLTGLKQHTGNWTGKTVETAKGSFIYNDAEFEIIDIPGTYSLMSSSEEERIARDYLCFEKYDVCVLVADACALEKSLNLIIQFLMTKRKAVLCVNLIDEAKKKGIEIDFDELSLQLGIPCIPTAARSKKGLLELCYTIYNVCNENKKQYIPKFAMHKDEEKLIDLSESALSDIPFDKRWFSVKLFDGDESFIDSVRNNTDILTGKNYEIIKSIRKCADDKTADNIQQSILYHASRIFGICVKEKYSGFSKKDEILDRLLTSKLTGIPIMLIMLGVILWITITGANYPSQWLSGAFLKIENLLSKALLASDLPLWVEGLFVKGVFKTVSWVTAVMLPPMAIFFPLFTLLEDFGLLPRIAFNTDRIFCKAGTSGRQALTMCMGFGCNACAVTGCRIISTEREKLIAIITNSLVPCNGRFPTLITIITMFLCFGANSGKIVPTIILLSVLFVSIYTSVIITKLLSKTLLKGEESTFTLELPPYRRPQLVKTLIRSVFDRTLFVLARAVAVAAPAGAIIWILGNVNIGGVSIIKMISDMLEPIGHFMGLDGVMLLAFILGFPANEIVMPIALMIYTGSGLLNEVADITSLKQLLADNGWSTITAVCTLLFCLFHFPCSTTTLTIYKETKSIKWTVISVLLPTVLGFTLCAAVANISQLILHVI